MKMKDFNIIKLLQVDLLIVGKIENENVCEVICDYLNSKYQYDKIEVSVPQPNLTEIILYSETSILVKYKHIQINDSLFILESNQGDKFTFSDEMSLKVEIYGEPIQA